MEYQKSTSNKPKKYWTLEKCKLDALKYNTKKEWYTNSASSYSIAHSHKWITECTKHMIPLGNKIKRLIYAFEFPDNSVYIGLTSNPEERKREHLYPSKIKKTSVYKYIKETKLYPNFILLTDFLDAFLASRKEGEYLEEYRRLNWKILNRKKTGVLGGCDKKWTKEKCIEVAKLCCSRKEFHIKYGGAYNSALKNNWLNEICGHMSNLIKPRGYWTKDICFNNAKFYSKLIDWRTKSPKAYNQAAKNKWLEECTKHMIRKRK
jgi:hypothetical protein